MNNHIIKQSILLLLFVSPITYASIEIIKSPSDSSPTTQKKMKVDGVWVGKGNITLIKQLDGYVILQGKDQISTWSAKGIINKNKILCRGSGVTNNGKHFIYESSLTLEGDVLKDTWKVIFAEGKEKKGKDLLKILKVEQPKKEVIPSFKPR